MKILTGEEKKTVYPVLFEKIFGYKPDKQIPRFVFVDDKVEGFVSGYLLDKETFYMSWAGHVKGMLGVRRAFNDLETQLTETGVKYFVARIENTNTVTQRLLMGMRWIPRGCIVTDRIYIEYYKEL
jgi:hypothetical protein